MVLLQINATYSIGSTGRIVKDIDEIASDKGITSYVACSIGIAKDNVYHIGNELDHKIHAVLCRLHGRQAYFSKRYTKKLIAYIESIKPNIVHLHNLHSNYININMLMDYLNEKNIPVVITMHDCWYFTGKCFHYTAIECEKWLTDCSNCPKKESDTPVWFSDYSALTLRDRKRIFGNCKQLYVVGASKWIADEARKSLLKNACIAYCYNGVNTSVFYPRDNSIRDMIGFGSNEFVILGMTNKWLLKQNEVYKNCLKLLLDIGIKIVLIGDVSNCFIDDRVKIVPTVNGAEKMAEWYSMADVFVNLTLEDTLPFVNIEAQACGTPVITHATSGATETISHETGITIEPGNPDMLVNAIEIVRKFGKKNYSEKCVERVHQLFDLRHSYDEYFRIYEEIYGKL